MGVENRKNGKFENIKTYIYFMNLAFNKLYPNIKYFSSDKIFKYYKDLFKLVFSDYNTINLWKYKNHFELIKQIEVFFPR